MLHSDGTQTDHIKRAGQVYGDGFVPLIQRKRAIFTNSSRCGGDACAVHNCVDGAKFLDSDIDTCFNRSLVRHVYLSKGASVCTHLLNHRIACICVEIKNDNVTAVRIDATRNRLANT